jgi:hypothetical protein
MTAPGNNALLIILALAFVVASGYASGRIHQWYRHGLERDQAYREGYDHASHSLFDMAMKNRAHKKRAGDATKKVAGTAAVPSEKMMAQAPAVPLPVGRARAVGAGRRRIPNGSAPDTGESRGRHSAA